MNGYFFTASTTRSRSRPTVVSGGQTEDLWETWNSWDSTIVCADNADQAQKLFEEGLYQQLKGETTINKIVGAQLLGQLLTERGPAPIDWPQIVKQAQLDLEATADGDLESGFWLDVNEVIPPGFNLEASGGNLPEDIRSGLNWSEDKQFFFLLSVLSPPPPPPESSDESEDEARAAEQTSDEAALASIRTQLADKEAAALIRARNSAIAAWLWRKYSADTKLAGNKIRIDQLCGVAGVEAPGEEQAE